MKLPHCEYKIFVVCRHWHIHWLSNLTNADVTNFQLLKKDEQRWTPWPENTLNWVKHISEPTSSNFFQLWTHIIFESLKPLLYPTLVKLAISVTQKSRAYFFFILRSNTPWTEVVYQNLESKNAPFLHFWFYWISLWEFWKTSFLKKLATCLS